MADIGRLTRPKLERATIDLGGATASGELQIAEVNGPGEARDQDAWKKALAAV